MRSLLLNTDDHTAAGVQGRRLVEALHQPGTFIGPWRDTTLTDRDDVDALLNSISEPHLVPCEVSTAVNSLRNSRPDLLTPVHR